MSQARGHNGAFVHEALFYRGEDEFLAGTAPFVREGLEADEPVLVALDHDKAELLRAELGSEAERVGFLDMREPGTNPARILPAWRDFVAAHPSTDADLSRLRGIGEPVWAERSRDELVECEHHEALLNLAFHGGRGWSLRCPYDVDALDDEVLDAALRTHPFVAEDGASRVSAGYVDPTLTGAPFYGDQPDPPTGCAKLAFSRGVELCEIRRFVAERAKEAGIDLGDAANAIAAVNELASNSLRHTTGESVVRVWSDDGALVCEVRDSGRISEPLVGRARPAADQLGGRGLWLVNQLCDLVQIRHLPDGNLVRIRVAPD